MVTSPRAVFLDRDGVLNRAELRAGRPHPPSTVEDAAMLPGAADACRRLAAAGWLLFVVTNQPDVARGTVTRDEVNAVNAALLGDLPITEVLVCPHDDGDACECRKPKPGMLLDAARRFGVDLGASVMIGDRWRDVEAGRRAGTRTMLVGDGYGEEELCDPPDDLVASLARAADLLLAEPAGAPGAAGTTAADDWESHWSLYADSASGNPAQAYRRMWILRAIGLGAPTRLLDIGSGQGDLIELFHERWPGAELAGIELSAEGIRRARAKVPHASFFQIDLITGTGVPEEIEGWADVAVCSEVLEHVDDPVRLLRHAATCIAPGGLLVVTVPGGPRTAFDRFIGHRRHFRPARLRSVLEAAGLEVERATGTGFPFFDLYKLAVGLRGRALIRDVAGDAGRSRLAALAMRGFGLVLRPGLNSSRVGWQLVARAHRIP